MKNNLSYYILLCVFSLSMILSTGSLVLADQVSINSAVRNGYGRLVFNWPTPVKFTAQILDKRLVVEFGRTIETDFSGALRSLSKYLGGAQRSANGMSVSFALKNSIGLRSFDSGTAIVVDLLDEAPKLSVADSVKLKTSPASGRVPEAVLSRSKGPSIKVRKGEHAKYSRIVFDWPRKVKYQFTQSGDSATLLFLSPAQINLGATGQRPPKFVRSIKAGAGNKGPTVTIKISSMSKVKHFLAGSKIVVDVFAPGTLKVVPKILTKVAAAGIIKPPAAKAAQVKKEARRLTQLAPAQNRALNSTSVESKVSSKPLSLTPGKGVKIVKGGSDGNRLSLPAALVAPSAVIAQEKALASIVSAIPLKGVPGAVTLRFNWKETVAAAVFPRGGALWIVFDRKLEALNLDALRAAGGNAFRSINVVPSNNGTALRLVTISGINPTIKRDGFAWIFNFKKQNLQLNKAILAKAQPNSPVGARIFMPIQEPGDPIVVTDPEVGDNLIVVPVVPLGNGVVKRYMYPQLQVLPSSQGIAIRPWVDNIRVRSLRQGVEISSPGKLVISSVSKAAAAGAKSVRLRALTRILDFKKWRSASVETFTQEKRKLQYKITRRKGLKREDARLNLAKFYMANGFSAEVMGVMRIIETDRPVVKNDPEFRLMRGIGSYMLGRFVDAKADINHKSIDKFDEGIFWQSVVGGTMGNRAQASLNLRRLGGITRPYPATLKYPLSLLVAEAAIDVGDVRIAKKFIDIVGTEKKLKLETKGQLSFTKGRFLELSGDFENAVVEWENAMQSKHRPSRVRARVARAELLLKQKNITRGEAIGELEKLRYAWRGDQFEFNLLRRIGRLYLEDGNFRNGLLALKQAATYFRKSRQAKEVTQEMANAFSDLYLNSEADSLPPVTAIALYDEFKELTPVGARGDEMIRKLADRLVAVDLLADGARLLEEQVKFRLKGEEKGRVAARLAVVHLMNLKFLKAQNVLNLTDNESLSASLKEERRHLKAQALMGINQGEAALQLLKEDKSINANLLRIEIFWNNKNWAKASQALRRLLRQMKAKPGKPLTDEQGQYVLNLAISLTLSGNEPAISRISRDFGPAMSSTSYGDAFRLITTPQTGSSIDYRTISSKVKDAELFTTFMAAYKKRLKQESLSGIN